MVSPISTVHDLRALGASAPMRAAYEASKRSGFHSVLFRPTRSKDCRSVPVGLGRVVPESLEVRERCLEDARLILVQGTRVFGDRVPTGVHAPWYLDPVTGREWPRDDKWWKIDIRSGDRLSDVKWVWEAARHRDLVVLARAAVLQPEGPWLTELQAMLSAWLTQCQPERGVNWYSSLELALRAIAWAQVLELVGDRLSPWVRAGLDTQLLASARHIMLELPYTVSSMKNNHLLGDGLGLVVLGRMFPDHPASGRWQRMGDALFLKQLDRHMRPDGSMIEDSLSYHRFVLEMLAVRVLIGGADQRVEAALESASQHLHSLGALDGPVPQYGDWDEGRVLADSRPAGSVTGSALAGLALSGWRIESQQWVNHDELAWYVDASRQDVGTPLPPMAQAREAGYFHVMSHGPWRVWFKTGSGPSHQHADITSAWIAREGQWIVRDPGTGTYNGPLEVRNGFRTSVAHAVWRPEGADQLVPHRAFRWLRTARVWTAAILGEDRSIVLCVHDAFTSEPESARVARVVDVSEEGVRIIDFVERVGERLWLMSLPVEEAASGQLWGIPPKALLGGHRPFRGWISETYGSWQPSPWLEAVLDGQSHAWGAGDTRVREVRPGYVAALLTSYQIAWGETGVALTVTGNGHERILRVSHD